jgi:hypothetical protein
MKDIRAVVLRRANFQVLAALTVSLFTPLTAMPAAVTFDLTGASFSFESGYGVDSSEVSSPTLLDVRFSTSEFVDQHFSLDIATSPSQTFLFGTVIFLEPNIGGGITSAEIDNLGVSARLTLTNPTGTTQILAAAGNATAGAVADSALDYTLAWNPVFVFFQGGQFRIDLTPLQFGRTGSKELNGTVTLLDQATGPISPIPVPSTAVLVGVGLAGLGFSLRRAHR